MAKKTPELEIVKELPEVAAKRRAAVTEEMAGDIEQAGRALGEVIGQLRSNTMNLDTVRILCVASAYLSNAIHVGMGDIGGDDIAGTQAAGSGLILPGSRR